MFMSLTVSTNTAFLWPSKPESEFESQSSISRSIESIDSSGTQSTDGHTNEYGRWWICQGSGNTQTALRYRFYSTDSVCVDCFIQYGSEFAVHITKERSIPTATTAKSAGKQSSVARFTATTTNDNTQHANVDSQSTISAYVAIYFTVATLE